MEKEFEYSKWERCKCSHGRYYYQRWYWKKGLTIEDSQPEIKSNKCKLCEKERNGY